MPATHKSTTHKPPPFSNPFAKGQDDAHAYVLKYAMDQTNWWRKIIGIGNLVLFSISLILFFYAVSLQQVVPVLVNVLPTGEATYLGEVRQSGEIQVPEAAIVFQIRQFVTNLRSVSIDPQVLFNNIDDNYQMVTAQFEPIMTRALRTNSPFDLVGRVRRTVEIESIIRVTGNSYQVDWIETSIETGGSPVNRRMRGLVTIRLIPPQPDFIRRNPLGIFIDNFEWIEL